MEDLLLKLEAPEIIKKRLNHLIKEGNKKWKIMYI